MCGLQRSSAKFRWYSNRLGTAATGTVEIATGRSNRVFAFGGHTGCVERGLFCVGSGAGGGAKSDTRFRFAFGLPREWVIVTSVLKYDENPGFRCFNGTI